MGWVEKGLLLAAALVICNLAAADEPRTAVELHISAQPIEDALNQFAQQTGLQVLTPSGITASNVTAPDVNGSYTPEQALRILLRNTGLKFEFVNTRTVAIRAPSPNNKGVGDKTTSSAYESRLYVAQVDQGVSANGMSAGATAANNPGGAAGPAQLEEVIVTAEKREERLLDVPMSVTVINPETLSENGQSKLVDYYATVPGLSVNSGVAFGGTQYVTIRGLSTGFAQNPTVAMVIDDVPTGSSLQLGFGMVTVSDIDPGDLARIEVLKGPQGTLYGADSLGGVIKVVTKDPTTGLLSGRVEVSGAAVPDGGAGYGIRGSVNIPVSDAFAIRASGLARRDPGYIENVTTGQHNFNSADVYGGHLAALLRPSNDFSLKVSALVQKTEGNGSSLFNAGISPNGTLQPTLGYLKQTGLPGTAPYTTEADLFSATFNAKVAGLEVISITGYGINKLHNEFDETGLFDSFASFGAAPQNWYGPAVTGALNVNNYETDKFSQELRLAASIGPWLDWLAGAFYTHESPNDTYQNNDAAMVSTGQVVGPLFDNIYTKINLSEYAVFGALTWHVADRFDVRFGARKSWNSLAYNNTRTGPNVRIFEQGAPSPDVGPTYHANGSAFTYLVTPEFRISPDLMVYGRVASGYRIGGPNFNAGIDGIPTSYKPDTTTNYELGIKSDLFDHRFSFDASAYYIAWKDFQINENNAQNFFLETNAGDARSAGLELSVRARPAQGLTIAAQGSFDNAELTQNLPSAAAAYGYGLRGFRLPYSIRWSGGFTVDQEIQLANAWLGFVGGELSYVGLRDGEFAPNSSTPRVQLPGYTTVNLRTGARYKSWVINLYVNNLGDERGIVGAAPNVTAIGVTGGYFGTVIQPRTVGLSVSRSF